ncbi:MAG: histidinol-phosphatase HisJ [Spirochaetales bacterium]|nr:histidinol-phosphatase HisJ [Spirochaetales bacterium]MCF7939165.1 histidinol-phosphatase HisJ [Spirochaetales bacterium]
MNAYTNYHTHSEFCDGKQEPEAYVKSAVQKGFRAIGFSGHAPLPFPNDWTTPENTLETYFKRIRKLKEAYSDLIEIYQGLEIDYLDESFHPASSKFLKMPLDYRIGSVHFLKNPQSGEYSEIDNTIEMYQDLLENGFSGDIQAFVSQYYRRMKEMINIGTPDIVGHMDLIRKNNRNHHFFSPAEDWYRKEIDSFLNTVEESNCILEVNTGAMARGIPDVLYPDEQTLRKIHARKIPITLSADAHDPKQIDAFYPETLALLEKIGFTEYRVLINNEWRNIPLPRI